MVGRRFGSSSTRSTRARRCIPAVLVGSVLLLTQLYLWVLHLRFAYVHHHPHSDFDSIHLNLTTTAASSSVEDNRVKHVVGGVQFENQQEAQPPAVYEPWIWNSSSLNRLRLEGSVCDEDPSRLLLLLRDATTPLSPCRVRPWIQLRQQSKTNPNQPPQVKILLTSYGWNHVNQTYAISKGRSKRQHELLQAIVDHPLFDPYGWDEILQDPSRIQVGVRYYVFLDVETCFEANYPLYLRGVQVNADVRGGRHPPSLQKDKCVWLPPCPPLRQALDTNLFRSTSSQATLVYFECRGNGQPVWYYRRRNRTNTIGSNKKNVGVPFDDSKLSIVSLSSSVEQLDPGRDMGLSPPAVSHIELTATQVQAIKSCAAETQRQLLFVFVGQLRNNTPRHDLVLLHNLSERVLSMESTEFRLHYPQSDGNQVLTTALFGAAPRGHNLFSYRFTEVLSAGAIPVVHSDGWVLPFRPELVDWNDCAVIISEADVNRTMDILRSISVERRCQMRQRCYEIYQRYMKTAAGTIDGILQGLELIASRKQRQLQQ